MPATAPARSSAAFAVFSILLPVMLSGCISTKSVSPVAESLDSLGITIRGVRESNLRLASRDGLTIERIRLATLAAAEEAANRAVAGLLDRIESILDRTLLKLGVLIALVLAAVTALMLSLRKAGRV